MNQFANPFLLQGQKLIKANGIGEAREYPMGINCEVPIFDVNDDILYIKTSDGNGFASLRRFRLTEEPLEEPVPSSSMVSREEFNSFKEEVLNGQHSILESLKSLQPATNTSVVDGEYTELTEPGSDAESSGSKKRTTNGAKRK